MKISLASIPNTCEDLLHCLYDLKDLDLIVYQTLKKTGPIRADTLAQKLNKERSTVYRSLQHLTSCGICIKATKTLEKGGYYHTYSCKNMSDIKQVLEHQLDEWYKTIKRNLIHL